MPGVGNKLPIGVKLYDQDATKYVQAYCKDMAGNVLFGGPVACVHTGLGAYENTTKTMPAGTDFVTVSYLVYNDPAFTQLSAKYTDARSVFTLDTTDTTEIKVLLDEIKQIILNGATGPNLEGVLQAIAEIDGMVSRDVQAGEIEVPGMLAGEIESADVVGEKEDGTISGETEPPPKTDGKLEC